MLCAYIFNTQSKTLPPFQPLEGGTASEPGHRKPKAGLVQRHFRGRGGGASFRCEGSGWWARAAGWGQVIPAGGRRTGLWIAPSF